MAVEVGDGAAVGDGDAVGIGEAVGEGEAVRTGEAVGEGEAVGKGVGAGGVAVAVAAAVGVAVAVGDGAAVATGGGLETTEGVPPLSPSQATSSAARAVAIRAAPSARRVIGSFEAFPVRRDYSKTITWRATSPWFIASNMSLTSSSSPRRVIISSSLRRPCM